LGKKTLWWPLLEAPLRLPTLPPLSRPRASRTYFLKNSKNGVGFDNTAATVAAATPLLDTVTVAADKNKLQPQFRISVAPLLKSSIAVVLELS